MSARIEYTIEARCEFNEWHSIGCVNAVTADEAIAEYRRDIEASRDWELRAHETDKWECAGL